VPIKMNKAKAALHASKFSLRLAVGLLKRQAITRVVLQWIMLLSAKATDMTSTWKDSLRGLGGSDTATNQMGRRGTGADKNEKRKR
jgi:hypothetical protein